MGHFLPYSGGLLALVGLVRFKEVIIDSLDYVRGTLRKSV